MKNAVSRFGKSLSGMVMPNIGAFIAWGFLTALFIEAGWFPNEKLASMVSPMLTYLLPILIAGQGGKMVAGDRGRVIAAIAVVGCICGSGYTMLMGAMVMGPLAGWIIKQFDKKVEGHIPAGFEMLVNNFSVGILGMLLAILGYDVIGPFMTAILTVLTAGVDFLVAHSLLPLVSVFIEPAKVLFLNNAINHGIFSPIGASQAAETGRSIMYMLEANPGPGLGILLAYCFFCKDDTTRQSAPGAVIIHLLGGIHEIYFPYILMNPVIIIAPIVGNLCAILFYSMTSAGLSGPASPSSLIAYMAMAPRNSILTVLLGVIIAGAVSLILSSIILKATSGHAKSLTDAQNEMKEMKAQAKGEVPEPTAVNVGQIRKIVFACDAGMGSSAMGATKFHNRIKAERPDLTVTNTSVDTIPADADVVVCQRILADRAAKSAPQAQLVTLDNFLADPHLDALYNALTSTAPVLDTRGIDIADNLSPGIKQKVFSGEVKFTNEEMFKLVQASVEHRSDVLAQILHPEALEVLESASAEFEPEKAEPVPMPTPQTEEFRCYHVPDEFMKVYKSLSRATEMMKNSWKKTLKNNPSYFTDPEKQKVLRFAMQRPANYLTEIETYLEKALAEALEGEKTA